MLKSFLRYVALSVFVCATTGAAQSKLHVAPNGDDKATGTLAAPFATLERAREEIRGWKKGAGLPQGGVTVLLRGGIYERDKAFKLGKKDSGRPDAPIIYRAQPGENVRLIGGRVVRGFNPVTDRAVLARLPEQVRGKVVQANLKTQGITDLGGVLKNRLGFYFKDKPMRLSRYPNDGFMKIVDLLGGKLKVVRSTRGDAIGKFTCDSERLGRWTGEKDPWVHGYWYWDWSDQRHPVKTIDPDTRMIEVQEPYHSYGYRKGQWFYAFNLLSEIDEPGEWYLDRETGVLYFYPPSPIAEGSAVVSVVPSMLEMKDVSHTTFERIGFEGARGTCIRITGGTKNEIAACTIHNIGGDAVSIGGGTEHGVVGCDIYNMGGGGIGLRGGNRKTLAPAGHYAVNNHIYHYGVWSRMYKKAVALSGVGSRAAHNLIHDAPHQAIGFGGNDHLIEFNEIHSVCFESNDAGAIYSGRDWTARGTIIRNNYMHHISGFRGRGCVGVYLDDMFCGTEISGNVFYKVTRAAFIGGGRDCLVENNIFVDCARALHIDARALGWAHGHADGWIKEAKTKGTLSGYQYQKPPYSTRWPKLARILEDEPKAPEGNLIRRNIFYGKRWNDITGRAKPYQTLENNLTDTDPLFIDYDK
ncbi:MAG: right-handed parallel beta-helix repeat-containing protein, partial [Lentisphaeria bacterium]|nr:right-handed parallel beta-helix repeat-containing protein [Lentisphaeria bacterium]